MLEYLKTFPQMFPVSIYYNTNAMIQHRPPAPTSEEPARIVGIEAVLKGSSIRSALQQFAKDPTVAPSIPVRNGSIWSSCRIVEVAEPILDAEVAEEYGAKAVRNAIFKTPYSSPQIDAQCPDIYWAAGTWTAAKTAAAAAITAAEATLLPRVEHAFCIVRPPGHHCFSMPSGFCFLNNVVLAARPLLHAGKKVAILDWDYHFGDGTANALWNEESVMFVSLHAEKTRSGFPTYPANTARDMKGDGLRKRSKGRSFNVQWLVDDADDAAYAYAFQHLILPALRQFAPDVILVSAGYDAIHGDALAGMNLSPQAFGFMARSLTTLGVPIVAVLEGGYDVQLLASGVANTILGLQHSTEFDSFVIWLQQEPAKIHKDVVDTIADLVLNGSIRS